MNGRTTITISKAAAKLFHASRERNGMEKSAFLELAVRAVNALTPEQRMQIQLGAGMPSASPSTGDAGQHDQNAVAKQASSTSPATRRQRGAA